MLGNSTQPLPSHGGMDTLFAETYPENRHSFSSHTTPILSGGPNTLGPAPLSTTPREQGRSAEWDRLSLNLPTLSFTETRRDLADPRQRMDGGIDPAFFNQCMQINQAYSPMPFLPEDASGKGEAERGSNFTGAMGAVGAVGMTARGGGGEEEGRRSGLSAGDMNCMWLLTVLDGWMDEWIN